MIVVDSEGPNGDGFIRQNYSFLFVRNEFLLEPSPPWWSSTSSPPRSRPLPAASSAACGSERNGGNIVRYNGDFAGS